MRRGDNVERRSNNLERRSNNVERRSNNLERRSNNVERRSNNLERRSNNVESVTARPPHLSPRRMTGSTKQQQIFNNEFRNHHRFSIIAHPRDSAKRI